MNILVTGGAGYIGSHACKRLLQDGHSVTVVDNLVRGHAAAVAALEAAHPGNIELIEADAGDATRLTPILDSRKIQTVLHFAALAYVGESVENPNWYYRLNVASLIGLLEACEDSSVERFVFSSSCATYGDPPPDMIPVPEACPQRPTSPYGWTKLMGERMLIDFTERQRLQNKPFSLAILRYFNVAGSDATGLLGEDHSPETHLIPIAIDAALGRRDGMSIFGTDYPTPDGTNIRDYVHVEDLIDAHVLAIDALQPANHLIHAFNVGIGRGYSVREILDSVQRVSGTSINITEGPRRAGDAIQLFNDPTHVQQTLGWTPRYDSIDDMIRTAFDWRMQHPAGYRS